MKIWKQLNGAASRLSQAVIAEHIAGKELAGSERYGKKLYHDNEAEFHDLAVIEAHLAGVAINVEQPLGIGHKVPVQVKHV